MERKSGFKECPRCGLRNKPSAPQCDFCGWEFKDASDEWITHVQVLEKMSREAEPIVIDEEVSRRIESTIIRDRKEAQPTISTQQAPGPEPLPPAPEQTAIVGREDMSVPPLPQAPPDEEQIKAFTETMVGPVAEPIAAAPDPVFAQATPAAYPAVVTRQERLPLTRNAYSLPMALLVGGAALYVVGLATLGSAFLSSVMGGALAVTGAILITTGANFVYDKRMASKGIAADPDPYSLGEEEVFICPKCHEQVRKADDRCPGCGAKFRKAV
jgi:hypothetical protein